MMRDRIYPESALVSSSDVDFFGVPFYSTPIRVPAELGPGRLCAPWGGLNRISSGSMIPRICGTIWPGAHCTSSCVRIRGGTGYAALVKVIEQDDARLTKTLEMARLSFTVC